MLRFIELVMIVRMSAEMRTPRLEAAAKVKRLGKVRGKANKKDQFN